MEDNYCIVCGEPIPEDEIYCIFHEDYDTRTTEEIFDDVEQTIRKIVSTHKPCWLFNF